MGDLVLAPINWLSWTLTEDGFAADKLKPPEKISKGAVRHYCLYEITGPVHEQFEKYKALRRQYGEQMSEDALDWLNRQIEALKIHASK